MAGQTLFPTALDSHTGANPFGFQPLSDLLATQLLTSLTSTATTAVVQSSVGWNARGFAVIRPLDPESLVQPEIVTYTSTAAQQLIGLSRGVGSVAKAWPAGSVVELNPVSRHHDDLAAAIVAIETALGIKLTWEAFTPSLTQLGAVLATASVARRSRVGKTWLAYGTMAVGNPSGATAANPIILNIPADMAAHASWVTSGITQPAGLGTILRQAIRFHPGLEAYFTAAQTLQFWDPGSAGTGQQHGTNPNYALAPGDAVSFQLWFEGA